MKIIVAGRAHVLEEKTRKPAAAKSLQKLDGLETEDACSDVFDPPLRDIGILGGTLKLVFDKRTKSLELVSEYRSARKLTQAELKLLGKETAGQWSDGIGESAFADECEALGVELEFGKPSRIEQVEDSTRGRPQAPSKLFAAAEAGDVAALGKLLLAGADLHARLKGLSPLGAAILARKSDAALFLIQQGAAPRAADKAEELQRSTMSGQLDVVAALIKAGADVNTAGLNGYTPLMWAVNREHLEIARLLVESGADVNARAQGKSVLSVGETAPLALVELLLKHGADPRHSEMEGHTMAEQAADYAKQLRERGDSDAPEWDARAALYRKYEKKFKKR